MKTVRFQIQLSKKFTLEELEESEDDSEKNIGTETALVFDKGLVYLPEDPNTSFELKGFFILCLPHGYYPEVPEFECDKFDKMIQTWLSEFNLLDSEADFKFNLNSYPTRDVFLIAPALKPWNKKTDIAMKGLYWWRIVDSFFSASIVAATANSSPYLVKEHFSDFSKFITNIMTGLYRDSDGIPSFDIPFLNNAMRAFYAFYLELKQSVAGYEANYPYLLNQLLNWVQSYKIRALYMGATWDQLQQANYMFKKVCGKRIIIELIQLLTATYVEAQIRDNLLFNIFCNSGDLIQTMVMDVFCVPRDLESGEDNSSNTIIRNFQKRGMRFDEALELHLTSVNNEMGNFKRDAEALAAEFPAFEQLQRYIYNYQCYVDGMIRMFPKEDRYGHCDHKILKVITRDESMQ